MAEVLNRQVALAFTKEKDIGEKMELKLIESKGHNTVLDDWKKSFNEIPASVSSDLTDISTYDVASTTLIYEPKPTQVEELTPVQTSKERIPRPGIKTQEAGRIQEHQIIEKQQTIPEFIPVPDLKNTMIVEDPRTQSAVTQKKKKIKRKIISKVAKQAKVYQVDGRTVERLTDRPTVFAAVLTNEEMKNFRARVEEVVRENEQLHQQRERNGAVSSKEWNQLQDQAKLVLEENQVLMEQLEIQQAKAKSSHSRHIQEVSKLTKQLMLLESEKQSQQKELRETQQELNKLSSKYDQLKATLDDRVRIDDHTAMVNDLKGKLQLEQEKHHVEVEELMGRIASLQAEKKSLLLEKTELIADNKTLEAELQVAQKSNRLAQKKIGLLKQQAEEAMEKEIAAHQYLANLIGLAEKTAHERDQLVHVTKSLTNEKHGVLNKIVAGNVRLGKLEEQVKMYKTKAAMKLGDMNNRMKEQEEDFARRTAQYQREIRRLQQLLKDKQETLDGLLEQQRQVESELETVWESTTRENRRIKDLLRGTVHKSNLLDTVSFDRSDIEGNLRKYLGSQSDFRAISYCDVILSSARRIEDRMTHENDLQLNVNKHSPHRVAESGDCAIMQQKKKKRREETVKSPMFESDSDQQQIVSSDESDKNEHDFYS
ncbi:centrosomal protein of 89 kDa [Rhincodon typus]|uniref:centrosomal protein of 89 kDa n=1 Tax=Rhincodon typus TaxID=259920 RepID=UPI00202ED1F2|nr:centrosomal protein of 89 kDa [Rhincodon typus]